MVWVSRIHCLQVLPRSALVAYPAPVVAWLLFYVAPLPHRRVTPRSRARSPGLLSRLPLLGLHARFRLPFLLPLPFPYPATTPTVRRLAAVG